METESDGLKLLLPSVGCRGSTIVLLKLSGVVMDNKAEAVILGVEGNSR